MRNISLKSFLLDLMMSLAKKKGKVKKNKINIMGTPLSPFWDYEPRSKRHEKRISKILTFLFNAIGL